MACYAIKSIFDFHKFYRMFFGYKLSISLIHRFFGKSGVYNKFYCLISLYCLDGYILLKLKGILTVLVSSVRFLVSSVRFLVSIVRSLAFSVRFLVCLVRFYSHVIHKNAWKIFFPFWYPQYGF